MSHRRARVASDLQKQLADILALRVNDPRLNAVTLVEVRPSPDFTFARVFYRTLDDADEVARGLERAKPFIRHCLAEVCQLRRVPELDFRLDVSLERAARVEELLGGIAADRARAQAEAERDEGGGSSQ